MTPSRLAQSERPCQSIMKQQALGSSSYRPPLDLKTFLGWPRVLVRLPGLYSKLGLRNTDLASSPHHGFQFSESLRYPRAQSRVFSKSAKVPGMSLAPPSTPSSDWRQVESRIQPVPCPRLQSLQQAGASCSSSAPLASLLFSAKPGLRPLWASAREPRVLARSQGCSRAALTMAPFRAELAHGTGVRVQTLRKGLPKMGEWWWQPAARSPAQPDVGVATSQLGPPSLGSRGPIKGKCGSRQREGLLMGPRPCSRWHLQAPSQE